MESLKELTDKTRIKFEKMINFPEINIPDFLKQQIQELIFVKNNTKVFFNKYTFFVETSPKHFAIIPNQYLFLATECYDLVKKLKYLFDFFDLKFRNDENLKKLINEIQDKISKKMIIDISTELENIDFSSLDNNLVTKDDFIFFIGNLKENKKFGNLEKNNLRTSEDLLGAYILNVVPLTTAASGYFGTLVYTLANNFDIYDNLCTSIMISDFTNEESIEKLNIHKSQFLFSNHTPSQTIYYGVPGSGKSHKIDELTKNLPEEQVLRVVFHPEYTNADFVGQILPKLNQESGNFEYKFSAGPFAQILRRSYLNPAKEYYLIIEEINRGNAAAIFGDLFQLLDRIENGKYEEIGGNTYTEGWSSYSVNNDYLNWYIREFADSSKYQDVENCVTIPEENKNKEKNYEKYATVNIGTISFISNTGIRLPPNLSILATMNTSDQNVFTLDNAFQRRWDMELVPNTCDDKKQMNAKIKVLEQTITWGSFQSEINKIIAEKGNESGFSSMEDKRLGCWFIKNQDGVIDTEKFANKVLKYLWDDAFKFNREEIFDNEIKNFEELKNSFVNEKGFDIFKDIKFSDESLENEEAQNGLQEQTEEDTKSENE